MKTPRFRFALYAIIVYLTLSTPNPSIAASQPAGANGIHVCGVTDSQLTKQFSDQYPNRRYARTSVANLNVGEPRTVRLIYFLPNDRPYRTEVVQRMKEIIRGIQTFYAEQMEAHGYGKVNFRIETDAQGEPMVHRVDGQQPNRDYQRGNDGNMHSEIEQAGFNITANVYLIAMDLINDEGGYASREGKNGGYAVLLGNVWFGVAAHELGHAFGLGHDFRDGTYIMSYGPGWNRLSGCAADFLSVHPYFNPDISIEEGQPPTIELISSPQYPTGSKSVLVRLKINDSDGLHQVLLHGSDGLVACHGFEGEREAVVEFDYDGTFRPEDFISLSSLVAHSIYIGVVDTEGNVSQAPFTLSETSPYHITTIKGHMGAVNFVALPRDEGPVASWSWDGTVKLWDVGTRHNITTLTARANSVALSADGTILASGSYDGTIELWDIATQQNIDTFEGHTDAVSSMALSADGTILASGSYDGTIELWDIATQQNIDTFEGHTDAVSSVALSADGAILASGSCDGTTKLWDVATQQNIDILEEDGLAPCIYSVAFSPDGAILAIGRGNDPFGGTVKLWEVSTRRIVASFVPHLGSVTFVSFSRDGGTLASGSRDGTVKLWDVATYAQIASLPHTAEVWSVSFSPDGGTLVSGTRTGTVELWDMSMLVDVRLEAATEIDIPDPNLHAAIAEAIELPPSASILRGYIERLTLLDARNANITDLTGLEGATNLTTLGLGNNSISGISAVAGLTKLRWLNLDNNSVSDISAVSGLPNLTLLSLRWNNISDLSLLVANTGLGNGDEVDVKGNPLSYQSIHTHIPALERKGVTVRFDNRTPATPLIVSGDNQQEAPGTILEQPFVVEVRDQNGEAFAGVPVVFTVTEGGGTLSITSTMTDENGRAESRLTLGPAAGTNTIHVSVEGVSETATFTANAGIEFDLSMPSGISLIHVPLKVREVNRVVGTIESVADLYDALGGGDTVNFLITYDSQAQEWLSYVVPSDKGTPEDAALTDDTGVIAGLKTPVSIRLTGASLGIDGNSTITLNQGLNLVGLPLRDPRISRVSDLLTLEGINANVPVIILTDGGEFKLVGRAGDPGAIPITGGQSFIMSAQQTAMITLSGEGWTNVSETAAAPPVAIKGIQGGNTTPVLGLRGAIVDEGTAGLNRQGFRVTVKNLSTGRAVATITTPDEAGYRSTVVDIETGRAATVGDILEISAQSPNPFIGVEPLQYTVTAEDVKRSLIQLPALIAYEIPTETELLPNYPNPFNPETWIPYRLAEDALVKLTIYDLSGQTVRSIDLGHQIASAYENRSKAIHWDGRNDVGEPVASSVYFYTLTAGDYSATRRMVILK